MLWWDWNIRQRLALLGAMIALGAIPWLALGELKEPGVILGGTAFLAIPQMTGWALYVGLHTGRMPSAYGRSERRDQSPTWFWITGAGYVAILLLFVCMDARASASLP
jgi:hypothetical protein